MLNTQQTLGTAIAELQCIQPDVPTNVDELTALRVARDCIDELMSSCISELRADPNTRRSWSDIAYALGEKPTSSVIREYGSDGSDSSEGDERARTFWLEHRRRFAWDFITVDLAHALYVQWMRTHAPDADLLKKKALTRRLKIVVELTGDWVYTRARIGSLTTADEPLLDQIPSWSLPEGNPAVWGFRRASSM